MSSYLELRRNATILRDDGGYDLAASQMNPVILEEFIGLILESHLPPAVWEPFSGRVAHSTLFDFAEGVGVRLLAQTLNPVDERIKKADSTEEGPECIIGGMLFHPPYFASASVSGDPRDVVLGSDKEAYLKNLNLVADLADEKMAKKGLVCAVGRDYRIRGKRTHLDLWFAEMFETRGYRLVDVWSSEPDMVLIFRRRR